MSFKLSYMSATGIRINYNNHLGRVWYCLLNINIPILYDPSILLLGIYPTEICTNTQKGPPQHIHAWKYQHYPLEFQWQWITLFKAVTLKNYILTQWDKHSNDHEWAFSIWNSMVESHKHKQKYWWKEIPKWIWEHDSKIHKWSNLKFLTVCLPPGGKAKLVIDRG